MIDVEHVRLTREREYELIEAVQTASGTSDRAWEELIAGHNGGIVQAASSVKKTDFEESYSAALEAFYGAVMSFDLELGLRLSTYAYITMRHAVLANASSDHLIAVPASTLRYYLAAMKKYDGDFDTAYHASSLGGLHITPENMVATYRAVSGALDVQEIDGEPTTFASNHGKSLDGTRSSDGYRDRHMRPTADPGHEEIDRGFIRRLFEAVDDEHADVVKLFYGFQSPRLAAMREAAGYRPDEDLHDNDVGAIVGKGRSTTQRYRNNAISQMRDAVNDDLKAEDDV